MTRTGTDEALAGGAAQDSRDVAQSVSHQFNRNDAECEAFTLCEYSLHASASRGYLVTCAPSEPCIRAVGDLLRKIGGC